MVIDIKPQDDVHVYLVLGYKKKILRSFAAWLKKKEHYLVILDTKKTLKLQNRLGYPNIIIKEIDTILDITTALSEIAWRFIFLNIELITLPSFERKEKTTTSQVTRKWPEIKAGVYLSASAFVDFKLPDLASAMHNINSKLKFAQLSNLKGYFKKTPAIICGAGPSLDQSFLQMEKKALIFSGGSALNALKVAPDFIGLVDTNTPLDFFQKSFNESILFFLLKAPNVILKKPFRKKFLCMEEESYLFFQWLAENIKLDFDLINVGWSTVTFLTALAVYFGCDPIVFNGVDLGFKAKQIYAENVAWASYEKKENQNFITFKNAKDDEVKTQNDWLMSAFFLQKLTASHPEITFYNTAENGLFLGENVKPFVISEMSGWTSLDLAKKLNYLASRPNATLKSELNRQILDLIDKELKVVHEDLVELEKIFNGQIDTLKNKQKSWCEENVLMVLWDIFKFVFLRDENNDEAYPFKEKTHQVLFFKDVLTQHKNQLKKYSNA